MTMIGAAGAGANDMMDMREGLQTGRTRLRRWWNAPSSAPKR